MASFKPANQNMAHSCNVCLPSEYGMIDHAGTVEFMGIFERERLSYGDTKVPWYSLWYVKLLIALSIVVLGNIFHHIFVYLWKNSWINSYPSQQRILYITLPLMATEPLTFSGLFRFKDRK